MQESKQCIACGAALLGPFQPAIHLTLPAGDEEYRATARARICSRCGLVHWYAEKSNSPATAEADHEPAPPQPDASYQRRAQMLRMLRRVKRM